MSQSTRSCCAATCGEADWRGNGGNECSGGLSVEAAALVEPAQATQAVVQPWQAPRTRPPPVCSALRCNLKLLHLTTVAVDKPLAVAIRRHVQPAALMLSCVIPTSDAWLPQL